MNSLIANSAASVQKRCVDMLNEEVSDHIFNAAYEAAEEVDGKFFEGQPYAAELVAAGALRIVADILAGFMSPYQAARLEARSRLDQLLLGKESS